MVLLITFKFGLYFKVYFRKETQLSKIIIFKFVDIKLLEHFFGILRIISTSQKFFMSFYLKRQMKSCNQIGLQTAGFPLLKDVKTWIN